MNSIKCILKEFQLADLVSMFEEGGIALPLLQREYVWRPAKIIALFFSLYSASTSAASKSAALRQLRSVRSVMAHCRAISASDSRWAGGAKRCWISRSIAWWVTWSEPWGFQENWKPNLPMHF